MRALQIALVAACLGVVATMAADLTAVPSRHDGITYRREKRRAILTTVFAVGMLLWPIVFLEMPAPVDTGWIYVLPLLWPLAMIAGDLAVTRTYIPTQAEMEGRTQEARNGGNWIIGAVFASGMLLAVLNKLNNGHMPDSAKVMLLGMLGIIAFLLPSPGSAPASTVSWATYAMQRVVLHGSIGMFGISIFIAWSNAGR